MASEPVASASGWRRWGRLVAIAVAVGLFLVLNRSTGLILPSHRRRAVGWFLEAVRLAHGVLLAVLPLATAVLSALMLRAKKRRECRPVLARWLLLGVSCLFGLILVEASAAAWRARAHRMPKLPETRAGKLPELRGFGDAGSRDDGEVEIVVIGESSARGQPYGSPFFPMTPWLSVGQIVGWRLGRAIPGRRFHVTIEAMGGETLEMQHQRLAGLERRPDLLIVYAGHNEFHARFHWERVVPAEEPADAIRERPARRLDLTTPLGRMIGEAIARNGVDVAPPPKVTRHLVDQPVCTRAERAEILADFERRLDAITSYGERIGTLPVLVIPPGNDAGYEPNRSVATGRLTREEVESITREFQAAKAFEDTDPARSLALFRAFLGRQPRFAEAHYRVARLLERSGDYGAAYREYILARDLDGFPQRCPSDFQEAYRRVASRHPGALLIDGQAVLRALSPHGILDDHLFHDGQHPVLISYVALAQAVLDGLRARHAFGWTGDAPAPRIDPAECAAHFGMTPDRWAIACKCVAHFLKRLAYMRHDPTHRLEVLERYETAAREILAGRPPEETGVAGLGVRPTWRARRVPGE